MLHDMRKLTKTLHSEIRTGNILCMWAWNFLSDLIIIPYKIHAYTISLFIKIKGKEGLGIPDSIMKGMS